MNENYRSVGVEKTPEQLEYYKLKDNLRILDQLSVLPNSERVEVIRNNILTYLNPSAKAVLSANSDLEQIKSEIQSLTIQRQELLAEIARFQEFQSSDEESVRSAFAFADFVRVRHPWLFKNVFKREFERQTGCHLCD